MLSLYPGFSSAWWSSAVIVGLRKPGSGSDQNNKSFTISCPNYFPSITQQQMASKLPPSIFRSARASLKRRRGIEPRQCLRTAATHTHSHHAQQISILRSFVDTSSEDFKENARQMEEAVGKLKELRSTISQGGTAKAREKHIKRGKMLPRECVWIYT